MWKLSDSDWFRVSFKIEIFRIAFQIAPIENDESSNNYIQ